MIRKAKDITKQVPVKKAPKQTTTTTRSVEIPALHVAEMNLRLVGDRPLLINNKFKMEEELDRIYGENGKAAAVKIKHSHDELYLWAFYTMPDSKYQPPDPKGSYGVPTSGIKKCATSAIRTTGISDNTSIGLISNSFWIFSDGGGLCRLNFKKLERDIRGVNIGTTNKSPQLRHRPMFHDWSIDLRIGYNPGILSPEQLVNIFMYAGTYIGLCEMRMQKKQGECGGFYVETGKKSK